VKRFFLLAAMLVLAMPAQADIFEPTADQICTPSPVPTAVPGNPHTIAWVKPWLVLDRLYAFAQLSRSDLNSKDPGQVDYNTQVQAILLGGVFCNGGTCDKNNDKKTDKPVRDKLDSLLQTFLNLVKRHQAAISAKKGGYKFTFSEIDTSSLQAFFKNSDGSRDFSTCVAAAPNPGEPKDASQDSTGTKPRIIVRKNVEDLHIQTSDSDFKTVKPASFSINSDMLKHSTLYGIDGVVGLGFGWKDLSTTSSVQAIPFFSYKRSLIQGKNPSNIPNVENIGGGVVGDLVTLNSDLQFISKYIHSNTSGADIVSGNFIYTPYPDPTDPYWGGISSLKLTSSGWSVMFKPQLKLVYGSVLDRGTDLMLRQQSNFGRYGTRLEFSITAPDDGPLKGLSYNAAYEYLRVFTGPLSTVEYFDTAIGYTFPKQDSWTLNLEYSNGRDLDTLVRQQKIVLGVGYKL
jgi:hypothetical protein